VVEKHKLWIKKEKVAHHPDLMRRCVVARSCRERTDSQWLQSCHGECGAPVKARLDVKAMVVVRRGALALQRARRAIIVDGNSAFQTPVAGGGWAKPLVPVE